MRILTGIVCCLAVAATAATAAGAEMGTSRGHDLDALWTQAQEAFAPEAEDAILLLEQRDVAVAADGAVATTVHEVVWIATSQGIRHYADLRVPWDSATATLEVQTLRTWMDGRWWPDAERISDTAVVHTLPYAVDHADDYNSLRETMLLHDGVELPCIMETVYTVTQRGLPGAEDVFVLPQRDPAALVRLTVSVPAGTTLNAAAINGAPEAVAATADGRLVRTWTLAPAPALRLPVGHAPSDYEPTVVWSTWPDQAAAGAAWRGSYDAALQASGEAVRASLEKRAACNGPWSELRTTLDFVDEGVRRIGYDDAFRRFAPRSADRTWSTGYAVAVDRAALLESILLGAGIGVEACYVGRGLGPLAPDVPLLAADADLMLVLDVTGAIAPAGPRVVYDVARGRLLDATALAGRRVVTPGGDPASRRDPARDGFLRCSFTLRPADGGGWSGTGYCDGMAAPADVASLVGVGSELHDHAAALVGAVFAGAELTTANPVVLADGRASYGFAFTLSAPAQDDAKAGRMVVAGPVGGVADRLPGDVHLADAARGSPVLLPAALSQRIEVRWVGVAERVKQLPASADVQNAAGAFAVVVGTADDDVVYTRWLDLEGNGFAPDRWPGLRALLLEEQDPRHGTFVFE